MGSLGLAQRRHDGVQAQLLDRRAVAPRVELARALETYAKARRKSWKEDQDVCRRYLSPIASVRPCERNRTAPDPSLSLRA